MKRKSWVAIFAVGAVIFGASGTVGFGQVLNNLFGERTVTHRSTKFKFGDSANAYVVSNEGNEGPSSKVKRPANISVKLPKSVGIPVLIDANVYQLELPAAGGKPTLTVSQALKEIAAGQHKLIAAPNIVGSSGNPTSFQSIVNVTLAKAYSPPTIPESYDGLVTGGMTIGEKAAIKTNDGEVILPPHPMEFEKRDIGLTLKFLPKIEKDGSVSVACDAENTALGAFADRGTKILRETKKLIGKKTRTEVLLENNQFFPTVLSQKTTVTTSAKLGKSASKIANSVSGPGEFTGVHGKVPRATNFGKIVIQDGLPPLLISVSAKKVKVAKHQQKIAIGKGSQIFLTLRVIEISEELDVISGIPDIAPGILTDPQFQALIRALNNKKGVDLLSAPSIMMRGDQTGKIEVIREFIYPTKYETPSLPKPKSTELKDDEPGSFPVTPSTPVEFARTNTGIEFGVMARPVNGNSIELQLNPEVTEFKGFLNFGEPIMMHDYQKAFGKPVSVVMTENRIEMPVFETRRLKTTVRIPDGGVVCLGGFVTNEVQDLEDKVPLLGDLPLVGKAFRSEVELHIQKRLYFFVRAQLMDPAGVPITKK